jgi:hypothetical protein
MKFVGAVGFETLVEVRPSNWQSTIVERKYRGDITRVSRRLQSAEKVNDDINISNEIEILSDAFAFENFSNIKYVVWMNTKWKVETITVEPPRLILEIGGVWNGKTGPSTHS